MPKHRCPKRRNAGAEKTPAVVYQEVPHADQPAQPFGILVWSRARVDGLAGEAGPARIAVHGMLAVDGLGEDLGAGGLSRAARPAEQVGVLQTICFHLIPQRPYDVVLPSDLRECRGPELAV